MIGNENYTSSLNQGPFTNGRSFGIMGGAATQQQTADAPETLQQLSSENANKCQRMNQQLAQLRSVLFGENEKDQAPAPNVPMPIASIAGSLSSANQELLEAFKRLDSILGRL